MYHRGTLCHGILPGLMGNFAYGGVLLAMLLNAVGGGLLEVLVSPIMEAIRETPKRQYESFAFVLLLGTRFGRTASTLYFTLFGTKHCNGYLCCGRFYHFAICFYAFGYRCINWYQKSSACQSKNFGQGIFWGFLLRCWHRAPRSNPCHNGQVCLLNRGCMFPKPWEICLDHVHLRCLWDWRVCISAAAAERSVSDLHSLFRFVMCNGLFALCVCADAVALPFGMRTVRLIGGTDVAGSLQYDLSVFSRGWHGNVCTFGLGGRCWVFFRSCIDRTGFRKRTKRRYLISYQIAYISAKYD